MVMEEKKSDHEVFDVELETDETIKGRHQVLIQLAVLNYPPSEIAAKLDYTVEHVRRLLRSPVIAAKISSERDTRFAQVLKTKMDGLCGLAAAAVEEVLLNTNEKGSTRLEAAKFVLEHTLGKAKATVEVKSDLLGDFISKLDQLGKNSVVLGPRDATDLMLDEVIGEDHVVGRRSKD